MVAAVSPICVTGDFIMPSSVILEGPDANMFSSAMPTSEGLEVLVASGQSLELANDYSFCFYVQNPTTERSSYEITISGSSCANIADTRMTQLTNHLHVVAKELVATAHQSNPFPCSSNTITLELTMNFHVRSGAKVTLEGLSQIHPSSSPDGKMAIFDASGGYEHAELFRQDADVPATADWISNRLIFTVASDKNLVAGERYAISFEVENPRMIVSGQSSTVSVPSPAISFETAPELQIDLTDTVGGTSLQNVVVLTNGDDTLGLCGNNLEDVAPLFIYEPQLTVHKIGQSSAIPCDEANVISVTLKSNMPLCQDSCNSALTLSGLSGALIPDGPVELSAILADSAHNRDHLVFSATEGGEGGFGMWSSSEETLTLFLTCCLECNFEYQIKFSVENPPCSQQAPAISVQGEGLTTKEKMDSMPEGPHGVFTVAPAAPLGILQPTFIIHEWSESSQIPCDDNNFSITLASNIDVPAGMVVTVRGLQDTASSMNELRVLPSNRTEYVNSTTDDVETSRGFNYSNAQWRLPAKMADHSADTPSYSSGQRNTADYDHRQQLLKDLQCQMVEENCPGPFTNCETTIAHRGSPLGYPDHTKEGYEAAVEMGACKLSCEAVFNKDGDLYCRQDRCDLHYTTDILTNPDNECLAKKCSQPFEKDKGAQCCASDFTAEELDRLCVTQEMQTNQGADTVADYLSLPSWKTPHHTAACHKIMSHQAFVEFAASHQKHMVVELLDETGPMHKTATAAAERLILDYTNSSNAVAENHVFVQSVHKQHVRTWLTGPKFNQAVLRIPQSKSVAEVMDDLDQLSDMTPPLRFASAHHSSLLTSTSASALYGSSWIKPAIVTHAKQHGMTLWAMGLTGGELQVSAQSSDFLRKDSDYVLLLHALMTNSVSAVFTDWAESVSHYENCVLARSSTIDLKVEDGSFNNSVTAEWLIGSLDRMLEIPIPQEIEASTNFILSFDLKVAEPHPFFRRFLLILCLACYMCACSTIC